MSPLDKAQQTNDETPPTVKLCVDLHYASVRDVLAVIDALDSHRWFDDIEVFNALQTIVCTVLDRYMLLPSVKEKFERMKEELYEIGNMKTVPFYTSKEIASSDYSRDY